MAIKNVECEHDGVLGRPEVGDNVDVHGAHHHGDPCQYQQKTQLQNTDRVCVNIRLILQ